MFKFVKNKILFSLCLSTFLLTYVCVPLTFVKANSFKVEREKEVIILYNNNKGKETVLNNSNDIDYKFKNLPAIAAKVDSIDLYNLMKDPNISSIEENVKLKISSDLITSNSNTKISGTIEDDSLWNLEALEVKKAWEDGLTGKGVKVAVIDTGISNHSDLSIVEGISTVDYTDSFEDDNGHGTHVAGIIGARKNGKGIVGVAPDSQIYAVKALDSNGSGDIISLVKGIDWAISKKVDIINLSLGTDSDSLSLSKIIEKAYNEDVLIVAAGGNSGVEDSKVDTVEYPAKYENVIAVSALDENLNRGKYDVNKYSASGNKIEFSAPGINIKSTYGNSYGIGSGTSQAAPHVSGLLAILKQLYPNKTNEELRSILANNYTVDLGEKGRDNIYGIGLVKYIKKNEVGQLPDTSEQEKLITDAYRKVSLAERNKKKSYVDSAEVAVNKLLVGSDKTLLQKRLNIVKISIINNAKHKVSVAKKSVKAKEIGIAQTSVYEISDKNVRKQLQKNLEKIINENYNIAKLSVSKAEKMKKKTYVNKAQKLVNDVYVKSKRNYLQKRLDKVKYSLKK